MLDELTTNTIISLHNLSFYNDPNSAVYSLACKITKGMVSECIAYINLNITAFDGLLEFEIDLEDPLMIECLNLLANLSQNDQVCQWLSLKPNCNFVIS